VFFNGSKAERSSLRHAKHALSEERHVFARLPSTSPAHAAMRCLNYPVTESWPGKSRFLINRPSLITSRYFNTHGGFKMSGEFSNKVAVVKDAASFLAMGERRNE